MKKYFILLVFLEFLIIKADEDDVDIFKVKCEDDKAKTDACLYYLVDSEKDTKEYAIFDKCGKGKHCFQGDDGNYQCSKKSNFKKRKSGQSCNYHEDCYSNSCVSNKCTLASEGEICLTTSHGNIGCKPGLTCAYDADSEKYKCFKLAKEDEEAKHGCLGGLIPNIEGKCKKYGTVDDGGKVPYNRYSSYEYRLLCKSGICIPQSDDDGNEFCLCVSLTTEPTCSKGEVSKEGEWSDKTKIPEKSECKIGKDITGTDIYYYGHSQLETKLFQDFLEDYKDLDLEKINSNEDKDYQSSLKWKTLEKFLLFKHAPELYAAGLIDSEGKRNDNKKCEYDFVIKNVLSSSFIKLNTLIIAMIALLLF